MRYVSFNKAYNKLKFDQTFTLAHFQHKTFTLCKHSDSLKFNRFILQLSYRYLK